jgi:hypothetical protein
MAATETPHGTTESQLRRIRTSVRLLPIIFFLLYLTFSVWLFAFGPWTWPVDHPVKLYLFLLCAHAALLLGYLSAAFNKPRGYCGRWSLKTLVVTSLAISLLLLLPTSAFRTGSVIPNIVEGINNPGESYFATNVARGQGGGPTEYARIVFGPLLALLLPLTVFYWRRLPGVVRLLALVNIIGFLAIYVALGTNKAIADVVILTPCLVVASACAGNIKLSKRRGAILTILSVLAASLFFLFFSNTLLGRLKTSDSVAYVANIGLRADPDNILLRGTPQNVRIGILGLTSYVTQGYYGLALALDEPFVPMFGVGNSMFLYFNAAKISGNSRIPNLPYPVRVEQSHSWDAYINWSSIYPWLASDVSFPGTIVVIFLIGRLFAMSWLDSLRGENPFAIAMLAQFIIMIFYFPANNQVAQTGEALAGFCGVMALWLVTRKAQPRSIV